ncbi:acetylornithine deacetylase [Desertibacillus haloalkaliphilus]|uniref:acetylornithine deacetylase n=1 Tax=Desertibacillus haloalkaliphilus TaxID=1328930 RepID=UPI001C2558B3|nr:acetylornithine deacetylase [Desertibacillus haloalkaliphilus]MBU8906773.1 acetylornithine deacetylase [Desertibacillus haloalkaliphilus]
MKQTIDPHQVQREVDNRKDELLELVQALVRYKTPSPPARNTVAAQTYIASYLEDLGFSIDKWDVYKGDPNVVGTLKGTEPDYYNSLIINGHIDVAEVDDSEGWNTDPFDPVIKDGNIYGRGTADMKAGKAASLFAIKLLKEAGVKLPGDLIYQSVIGEEVGEAGTLECCRRGYDADFAVVVDTSDCHIQGQGGVITGWITVQSPKTFHDATRRNMLHAGGSLFGASAIEKMMKIIEGLQSLEQHWAVTKSYPGFPAGMNTINPAVIEGGRHAAFIADKCSLWITVHFYPDENHEDIIKEIEEHVLNVAAADPWLREHPPTFDWGGQSMIEDRGEIFPSLAINNEWPGLKTLASSHQHSTGTLPTIGMSPTVTDGGWLAEAGIPTVIYGPGDLQNAHAVNEHVPIDQLLQFTKVMIQFIYEWCHTKKSKHN